MNIRNLLSRIKGLRKKISLTKKEFLFEDFLKDTAKPKLREEDLRMDCGCQLIFIDGKMSDREIEELLKGREDQLYCEKHRKKESCCNKSEILMP